MATHINLLTDNPTRRRLRAIQADKLFWQEQRQYLRDCWDVLVVMTARDLLDAFRYLWKVAVCLTVLHVWGWL